MDTETIITLLIIAVSIIWNLVVKIREKLGSTSSIPFPTRSKHAPQEIAVEDLGSITDIAEQVGRKKPVVDLVEAAKNKRAARMSSSREEVLRSATPSAAEIGQPSPRKRDGLSRRELRKAIVWSEILSPPVALRSPDDRN